MGDLVILLLFSLAWLFYFGGASMNAYSWWCGLRAKEGERVPSGIFFVFGLYGCFLAYHSVYTAARHYHIDVPWPLLWVLLPLFLDVYCVGALVFALLDFVRRRKSKDEQG